MPFNMFPYTNLHNLNLDWILAQVKAFGDLLTTFSTTLANAVLHSPQQLTDAQKAQARTNIGALSAADVPTGTVRYDAAQELTGTQQTQARTNIGAGSSEQVAYNADNIIGLQARATALEGQVAGLEAEVPETYVSALAAQTFSSSQQARARQNIGAISASEVPAPEGAVLYNAQQHLTATQKSQARINIDAVNSGIEILDVTVHYPYSFSGPITDLEGPNVQDFDAAIANGKIPVLNIILEGDGQGVIDTNIYIPVCFDRITSQIQDVGAYGIWGVYLAEYRVTHALPKDIKQLTFTHISTT